MKVKICPSCNDVHTATAERMFLCKSCMDAYPKRLERFTEQVSSAKASHARGVTFDQIGPVKDGKNEKTLRLTHSIS